MSLKRKKTVLRTMRISQQLDFLLQKDAQANNMSVNAFINSILTKYSEWDTHVKKFGFISVTNENFRAVLREVDDKKLENIAKELGSRMPKAVAIFWFKKLNLETVLKLISLYSKYSGLFTHEIELNKERCIITFRHKLGKKGSIFLRHFMSGFIKSSVGIVPQTEVTNSLIVVSFAKPLKADLGKS